VIDVGLPDTGRPGVSRPANRTGLALDRSGNPVTRCSTRSTLTGARHQRGIGIRLSGARTHGLKAAQIIDLNRCIPEMTKEIGNGNQF
jgi:hypothetical protein